MGYSVTASGSLSCITAPSTDELKKLGDVFDSVQCRTQEKLSPFVVELTLVGNYEPNGIYETLRMIAPRVHTGCIWFSSDSNSETWQISIERGVIKKTKGIVVFSDIPEARIDTLLECEKLCFKCPEKERRCVYASSEGMCRFPLLNGETPKMREDGCLRFTGTQSIENTLKNKEETENV